MQSVVFVYGTLMLSSGHPMGRKLAAEADFLGVSRITGRLYHLGKWPGLVLSAIPTEIVHGEAWLPRSAETFGWMDEYEGILPGVAFPEYERILAPVEIAGSGMRLAHLYAYRWPVDGSRRIWSGRWTAASGLDPNQADNDQAAAAHPI